MAEWLTSLRARLRALVRRDSLEQDLRDEMAFHLAMREDQLRGAGTPDAATLARRRFGSASRIHEELRDAWALAPRASAFAQDLRYAMRTLLRHRGFTAVVVLTLAFGIAINTATFSIVNAVLLRPLGFPEPGRLVMLEEHLAGVDFGGALFSPPDFLDVERDQESFSAIAAYVNVPVELSGGEPMRVVVARASAALVPVLGVAPLLGRTFTPDEDRPGADVAVLSWRLWQSRYGADAAMVGRPILLDRRPHTVIGVMPPGFEFPTRGPRRNGQPADVWVPMAFTDRQRQLRGSEFTLSVVGRLNPDVSIDAARAELEVLASRINERYPPILRDAQFSIRLSAVPLHEEIAGPSQRPLLLLLAAVGLVLLVTCANVANLVLSRVASRTRELALRAALGSGRGRLLQLLLAEAALVSIAGALVGVLASRLIVAAVPVAVSDTLPAARNIPIDLRVLAFTAAVAAGTSLLFALVPLATLDRRAPGAALQDDASRTTPGLRRHRLQAGLVVSTVTLACVLLVAAGLLVRSFAALMATDGGFERDRVLTAALTLPRAGYSTAASVRRFHAALFDGAASLRGVRSVALATDLPFERYEIRTMAAEGGVQLPDDGPPRTYLSWVHGPYFETLGIRLTRGRMFLDVEHGESRHVVVVNERLARTFWPGEDPLGKRLRWGLDVPENPNPWLTVVGVVADVADGPPGAEPHVHAYEPFRQFPDVSLDNIPNAFGRHLKLAVRTDGDPRAMVAAVRAEIGRIDPQLAIESIATMDERIAGMVAPRRFSVMTLGAFAAGSLLLAALGLYGLLAFSVTERRRELAVRLALGADRATVVRMVVLQGLRLVAVGLVTGLAASYGTAHALGALLYQTERHDAVIFAAVPIVLVLVGLVACARPAWRASRVEPMTALRAD